MKKIVRLTESDLARIVKRVIRENKLLNEGVPKTAVLSANAAKMTGLGPREVCKGADFITQVSIPITNTGTDAYINEKPRIIFKGGVGRVQVIDYSFIINNKPSWSNPDGQAQSFIPKGKTAILKLVISTDVRNIYSNYKFAVDKANEDFPSRSGSDSKKRQAAAQAAYAQQQQNEKQFQSTTSGTLIITYNGAAPLEIPINVGPFTINQSRVCDKEVTLPKGF